MPLSQHSTLATTQYHCYNIVPLLQYSTLVPSHLLSRELVLELINLGLGIMDDAFALVNSLNHLPLFLVLLSVLLGVADHVLDVFLAEAAGGLDHN